MICSGCSGRGRDSVLNWDQSCIWIRGRKGIPRKGMEVSPVNENKEVGPASAHRERTVLILTLSECIGLSLVSPDDPERALGLRVAV